MRCGIFLVLALLALLALFRPTFAQAPMPTVVLGGALAPNASGITMTSVTCGATSTAFGVTGGQYLAIQVPPGGSQVCFATGTTAATTSPPSKCYPGGTDFQFAGGTGTCIVATGSQAISVWTR